MAVGTEEKADRAWQASKGLAGSVRLSDAVTTVGGGWLARCAPAAQKCRPSFFQDSLSTVFAVVLNLCLCSLISYSSIQIHFLCL